MLTSPPSFPLSQSAPVVIAGAGPAALLLASAFIDQDVPVVVVAPAPDTLWPENHASWHDELKATELGEALHPVWRDVVMIDADGGAISLRASYGLVDKRRTQARLVAKVRERATLIVDKVASVSPATESTQVQLENAPPLHASFVVDATGAAGLSVTGDQAKKKEGGGPTLFQTALGGTFLVGAPKNDNDAVGDAMVLMDWRPAPGADADALEPSFLYVMPQDNGEVFFEETILIGPRRDPETLRARLLARLHARFDDVKWCTNAAGELHVEHCVIPMNAPLQRPTTHAVFGAAAGAIHPATGYSVGWSARHAPKVAAAIRAGLLDRLAPDALARKVDQVVWTADAIRERNLLLAGAEVLKDLTPQDVSHFFAAFFAQDAAKWMAFMTRDQNAAAVLAAMWGTFAHAPMGLKVKMMRLGAWPLLRSAA